MIVTIDGPAGSGKSTAARLLAERLGFEFLDTGAMYRAVGLELNRRGIDLNDLPRVSAALPVIHLEMSRGKVMLNGEDVSHAIRSSEAGQGASRVAVIPAVRLHLADEQRRIAEGRTIVCEGRDQGSFVFPHAECKFFLTAEPLARAERRHRELLSKGQGTSLEEVLKSQQERDARDSQRDLAPMKPADDAILLDTTHLDTEAVVERLLAEVARRCPTAPR